MGIERIFFLEVTGRCGMSLKKYTSKKGRQDAKIYTSVIYGILK